jgi:hypothetical protein
MAKAAGWVANCPMRVNPCRIGVGAWWVKPTGQTSSASLRRVQSVPFHTNTTPPRGCPALEGAGVWAVVVGSPSNLIGLRCRGHFCGPRRGPAPEPIAPCPIFPEAAPLGAVALVPEPAGSRIFGANERTYPCAGWTTDNLLRSRWALAAVRRLRPDPN